MLDIKKTTFQLKQLSSKHSGVIFGKTNFLEQCGLNTFTQDPSYVASWWICYSADHSAIDTSFKKHTSD